MASVRHPHGAVRQVESRHDGRDEQARMALVHEHAVRALERLCRAGRVIDGRMDERARERHEECRSDALARDIGDDDAQRVTSATEPEEIEEVAADLARRLVVAGDRVARHVRRDERHEAPLQAAAVGELRVPLMCQRVTGCPGRIRFGGDRQRRREGRGGGSRHVSRGGRAVEDDLAGRFAMRGDRGGRLRRPGVRAAARRSPFRRQGDRRRPRWSGRARPRAPRTAR